MGFKTTTLDPIAIHCKNKQTVWTFNNTFFCVPQNKEHSWLETKLNDTF